MKYKLAIVGGTFDRLHVGHKKLLDAAFSQSEKVSVGVSQPSLYHKKYLAEHIESYALREQTLYNYLKRKNYTGRSRIVPIKDMYGNTLTEKATEAIFATEENIPNLRLINQGRSEIGFPELQTIIVPYVRGTDGKIVTSERIRLGEIDRYGNSYSKILEGKTFELPILMRDDLRKPIGQVFHTTIALKTFVQNKRLAITVGDIVLLSLLKMNLQPDVSIFDYITRRHILSKNEITLLDALHANRVTTNNKPGFIEKESTECLRRALEECIKTNKKQAIIIQGEEDLMTLPAILLAPLESIVLYGQYDTGAIGVLVTEEKKHEVVRILNKFSPVT